MDMKNLLSSLLEKIKPTDIYEEWDTGEPVGLEILPPLSVYERLLPHLLPCEIERGSIIENEVEWSTEEKCSECGDKMFWQEGWDKWVCRSWIYMEGGC